jgi:hypothetical protein
MDEGLRERVKAAERWQACERTRSQRLRDWFAGVPPQPMPSYRGPVEPPLPNAVGICCSGGGVRSAAFNLGALQTLERSGELRTARYLAAVSGGSYIAAAMSMVANTWPDDQRPDKDPEDGCNGFDDSNPELLRDSAPFAPGSPEEQYLRNRSSYLAPGGMDKLFLAYRLVLGVLFNVAFLALPLFGAAVLLGVFVYRPAFPHLLGDCARHCSATLPWYMWGPPVALGIASALLGAVALLVRIKVDRVRAGVQVWSTRLLVAALGLAALTMLLPVLVAALAVSGSTTPKAATPGILGASGLVGVLAGVVAHLREMLATPANVMKEASAARKKFAALNSRLRQALAWVAGALVGPLLLASVIWLALSLTLAHASSTSINALYVVMGIGALVAFALLYSAVDLTSWSLHPFYKRRLCTAFALKRVRPSDLLSGEDGAGATAIAQAGEQGIAVERDFDTLVPLSQTAPIDGAWPTLLVCAAANISDSGATPAGRHVTSFTFSAHSVGGPLVGGIDTVALEDTFSAYDGRPRLLGRPRRRRGGRRRRDLTLPAAVAMSGAALAPSMGKMTRRPLTFLLALANVRLGVWVPNPRWVARPEMGKKWVRYGRARPFYLACELLGHNRVNAKYLYVTDGGHYENLGLVELLRRGCTEIFCLDASGGNGFSELGDAIALARSELGVQIKLDTMQPLTADAATGIASQPALTATFTYEDGTSGTLVYARNVMTEAVPWDVKAYRAIDHAFPEDSTTDQLYTDQRFEAYRALGVVAAEQAIELMIKARTGETASAPEGPAAEGPAPEAPGPSPTSSTGGLSAAPGETAGAPGAVGAQTEVPTLPALAATDTQPARGVRRVARARGWWGRWAGANGTRPSVRR